MVISFVQQGVSNHEGALTAVFRLDLREKTMDEFMQAAIDEAKMSLAEGGIPIGSVIVHNGQIIGREHNRRVQQGSAILHGEMDAFENAGRQPAQVYRQSVLYTVDGQIEHCQISDQMLVLKMNADRPDILWF